ncbi:MAG: VWA domain-containing protein [Sulfuricurvum sp.]|nr:VWA domain-containing protein [Sulfuricurvum sp.]
MNFISPFWLFILILLPLYFWLARKKKWNNQGWLLISIAFLILSLARPVIPQKPISVEEAGSDVIFAVDLSYSMRGNDVKPSRLEVAKRLLREVVHNDRNERFGVIGFTTSAIVLSPLTKDRELLEHLFNGLDESQIITKGTDMMGALELARKMSHAAHPILILLTDGGDEASYTKEADFVQENNLAVSVVMLASREGSTLPMADGTSLKDDAGHIVVSARNDAIEEVIHDGRILNNPDSSAIRSLIDTLRRDDFAGSTTVMHYQELFYLPLVVALFAFITAFTSLGGKISRWLVPLVALIGLSAQGGTIDFIDLYFAKKNYDQGKFDRAEQLYRGIDSSHARYNRAACFYKAGKYQESLGLYRMIQSDDPVFKAAIFYNMGNCYIRLQEFSNARESFIKSLTLRYTRAADQNLRAIDGVSEQQTLNVRKEKKDAQAQDENKPTGEKKASKEGGGSNMKSDVASGGGGDEGKKAQSDPRISMSQGKAKLSSRQYELINQRSVHETKPW